MGKNNKRHDYEKIKKEFTEKDYTLVSTEYKNNSGKLDYICNKHQYLGIQQVSYVSFSRNKCNCSECYHKDRIGKKHNLPKQIDLYYDDYFNKYKEKLLDMVQDEYSLESVSIENKRTILYLKHNICNTQYVVEQFNFFNSNCRCQNPRCKHERKSQQKLKSLEQVKKEVSDLIGDEYEIISDYVGTNENVTFYHKLCDNTFKMTPHNFLAGQRCPHCTITPSTGECAIINILKKMNVKYTFQKSFDDLIGYCGYPLSYDFYLPKFNLLIEYQGEYHDGSISFIPQTKIQKAQEYDQIKREYANLME